ncbi:MAG TPA: carboxypeptidase-like regulatory domain-containing protein [Candidatus Binatia bacterium]
MSATRARFSAISAAVVAAALAACSLFGGGAARYDFTGTVVSMKDDFPIPGVKVTAACDNPKLDTSETTTNIDGDFHLEHAFAGDIAQCDLAFEHPKYRSRALRVDPRLVTRDGANRLWRISVRLEPG